MIEKSRDSFAIMKSIIESTPILSLFLLVFSRCRFVYLFLFADLQHKETPVIRRDLTEVLMVSCSKAAMKGLYLSLRLVLLLDPNVWLSDECLQSVLRLSVTFKDGFIKPDYVATFQCASKTAKDVIYIRDLQSRVRPNRF